MSRWLRLFALAFASLIAGESDAAYLLYVADYANEEVRRYHPDTGELVDVFAAIPAAQGVALAPDGDLLAGAYYDHNIRRFDVASKMPKGVFAQGPQDFFPTGLSFGPDGDLFVPSYETPQVLRFDGATGAFEGVFAEANGGRGFTHCEFGPNGDLFVSNPSAGAVLRYDGYTGASKGVFAASNELGSPHAFAFSPTGDMIVASAVFDRLLRFDGVTGEYRGVFAEYLATDLSLSPDGDVFGSVGRYIRRFDGRTGAFKGIVVDEPGANLGDIAYGPVPEPSTWLLAAIAMLAFPVSRVWACGLARRWRRSNEEAASGELATAHLLEAEKRNPSAHAQPPGCSRAFADRTKRIPQFPCSTGETAGSLCALEVLAFPMSREAPLSTLLEVLARSQRELERLEAEREQSRLVNEQARSLIHGASGGRDGACADAASTPDEGLSG